MPTTNLRQINGVVRTSEPVWSNLERLAEAASVWFTYDTHNGVYSWVINDAGNSVASLDEADIIGPIQIAGSGLTNLYNAVEIEYPRSDIRDQPHYVTLNLPDNLRNDYEPDNTLQITSEFINNQPQAEYVAMVTLKQSRLDRTITIVMDYTKINLQAGDIIDVTSPTYGWTAKEFRIMRVREIEGDDGSLRLEFMCSEYDDTIYDGTWNNFLVGGPPGIPSISAIGVPGTPVANVVNTNGVPSIQVVSTVPTGIVDRMQFWAGNVLITGNVANTTYNLIGTVASPNANSFTANSNSTFTTSTLTDGTWVWKARGINGYASGPFSNVSANLSYSSANIIGNAVANSNIVVNSATGGTIFQQQLSQGYQYSVSAGKITSVINQSANTTDAQLLGYSTFTVPSKIGNTMGYKIDVVFDQNGSGAEGGRGATWSENGDWIGVQWILHNGPANALGTQVTSESSGGVGAFYWTDFATVGFANLVAGNTYTMEFLGVNYTESNPTDTANITAGWNIFTNNNASF